MNDALNYAVKWLFLLVIYSGNVLADIQLCAVSVYKNPG